MTLLLLPITCLFFILPAHALQVQDCFTITHTSPSMTTISANTNNLLAFPCNMVSSVSINVGGEWSCRNYDLVSEAQGTQPGAPDGLIHRDVNYLAIKFGNRNCNNEVSSPNEANSYCDLLAAYYAAAGGEWSENPYLSDSFCSIAL